jgi:hypothetical protein
LAFINFYAIIATYCSPGSHFQVLWEGPAEKAGCKVVRVELKAQLADFPVRKIHKFWFLRREGIDPLRR